MKTRILYTANVNNVAELKAAIDLAMVETRVAFKDQKDSNEVLVFGVDAGPLRLHLIEATLTDGSLVYDLNIE